MITIPAMYPFPALEFEEDVPALRMIAHALTVVSGRNTTTGLCENVGGSSSIGRPESGKT